MFLCLQQNSLITFVIYPCIIICQEWVQQTFQETYFVEFKMSSHVLIEFYICQRTKSDLFLFLLKAKFFKQVFWLSVMSYIVYLRDKIRKEYYHFRNGSSEVKVIIHVYAFHTVTYRIVFFHLLYGNFTRSRPVTIATLGTARSLMEHTKQINRLRNIINFDGYGLYPVFYCFRSYITSIYRKLLS